jgi:hypothetical protein
MNGSNSFRKSGIIGFGVSGDTICDGRLAKFYQTTLKN